MEDKRSACSIQPGAQYGGARSKRYVPRRPHTIAHTFPHPSSSASISTCALPPLVLLRVRVVRGAEACRVR